MDLKLELDQYGSHGVQPYTGYQNLFLGLFKKDRFFTPQFKISRKFSNIARNSLYIYVLDEDKRNPMNSKMLQVLDENYTFKHLRGSVSTCDSGHFEEVNKQLKEVSDHDFTLLILRPMDEQLKGTQYFKKIEYLRYVGDNSDVFKRLKNDTTA